MAGVLTELGFAEFAKGNSDEMSSAKAICLPVSRALYVPKYFDTFRRRTVSIAP